MSERVTDNEAVLFMATHFTLCGQGLFLLSDRVECARAECAAVYVYRKPVS